MINLIGLFAPAQGFIPGQTQLAQVEVEVGDFVCLLLSVRVLDVPAVAVAELPPRDEPGHHFFKIWTNRWSCWLHSEPETSTDL